MSDIQNTTPQKDSSATPAWKLWTPPADTLHQHSSAPLTTSASAPLENSQDMTTVDLPHPIVNTDQADNVPDKEQAPSSPGIQIVPLENNAEQSESFDATPAVDASPQGLSKSIPQTTTQETHESEITEPTLSHVQQKKHTFGLTKKSTKQHKTYSETVYNSRFTHFRVLRMLSVVVGGVLMALLCFGLWRLYITVFHTIEDTQTLFLMTETRRTDLIDFGTLERVRASWDNKYATTTPESSATELHPVFGLPPVTTSTLDTSTAVVEE